VKKGEAVDPPPDRPGRTYTRRLRSGTRPAGTERCSRGGGVRGSAFSVPEGSRSLQHGRLAAGESWAQLMSRWAASRSLLAWATPPPLPAASQRRSWFGSTWSQALKAQGTQVLPHSTGQPRQALPDQHGSSGDRTCVRFNRRRPLRGPRSAASRDSTSFAALQIPKARCGRLSQELTSAGAVSRRRVGITNTSGNPSRLGESPRWRA
jgi:hypothetical protein